MVTAADPRSSPAPPLPAGERQGRGGRAAGSRGRRATALSRRAMEQPRRITDSFPRRRRRLLGRSKAKRCPQARRRAPPPAEEPAAPAPDQALLEMLRGFDLAWEYGPCTGESPPPDPPKPLPGSPLTLPPPQVSPACSAGSGRRRWG